MAKMAVVTGVAGFIGSHLAEALVLDGYRVVGVDNLSNGFEENVPSQVDFRLGDVRDLDFLRSAMSNADVVFHQAAIRSVPKSVDDPLASNEANVVGTLTALVAADQARVGRFIYASSSSVYGDPPEAFRRESQATQPTSPYAVSKLAGEQYCRVWWLLHQLPTVSLRYFNVFGPRQRPDSLYSAVFPAFVSALLAGKSPEVHWDGEQSRDFTYVGDIVRANLLAAEADPGVHGEVFNIGSGSPRTINETLRMVAGFVGEWIEPTHTPMRSGDVRSTHADISKAKELLKWEPLTTWDHAVEEVVNWFKR